MTKSERWFNDNVVNNVKEMKDIAELSARSIEDKISMQLSPELCIAAYGIIFDTILKVLKKKQKKHSAYQINICNVLSISYDSLEDDEAEKMGNFMPFIQQICNGPLPDTGVDDSTNRTIELCTAWNSAHITVQPETINEIASDAVREFQDKLNLRTADREYIMPIFCLVHEQIIAYLRLKRVDNQLSHYDIDVAGLYTVSVSETDNGDEIIEYVCSVYSKLSIKDDANASEFD